IATLVTTEAAQLSLRDVVATPAPTHPVLRLFDRVREALGVLLVGLQQIERDALRRLGADAGQPAELVDERLDRTLVHVHRWGPEAGRPPSTPPRLPKLPSIESRSRPPVAAPSFCDCMSFALW